jgi:hypothetical protein
VRALARDDGGVVTAPGDGLALVVPYVELGLGVLGGLASAVTIEEVGAAMAGVTPHVSNLQDYVNHIF